MKTQFEKIRQSFESEGYQLLTKEYKNNKQKLDCICPNDHKHSISWNKWTKGQRCGKCLGKHKTIKEIRESFESEGYQLLTKEYKNNKQKLEFICPNGHHHSIKAVHWFAGHRCNFCMNATLNPSMIQKEIESEGYTLLSKYINIKTELTVRCPNGHIFTTLWQRFKNGSRCKKCLYDSNRLTYFDILKKSFEFEGYTLLLNACDYQNAHQLLEFICPNGHRHFIKGYCWQAGQRCGQCSPNISKAEKEIVDFLKPYFPTLLENDRSIIAPLELDIVIPSKKIAIEYCGLYWHSELSGKDRKYHLDKLEKCKEKSYQLITVFEDEWLFQKDIVKLRLKQILGISDAKRIHARDCEIKEITTKESSPFLKKFHIQGAGGSRIKLGAFYDNKLVSVMTFSVPNIAKGSNGKDFWELNRFCSHSEYHIPGIASKLLKYFERNYEWNKIISYADRRWSNGNLYRQLGFEQISETNPNYWYFQKNLERIHRFALRKKTNEPKDKTEWELRQLKGWNRIWDCGNLRFEKVF